MAAAAAAASNKRVFKKGSPNDKLTVYLGKRDFFDHGSHVDPIDGMVTVDPDAYLQGRKVFASITVAFSYGFDDMDLLGVNIFKELYKHTVQVYPPPDGPQLLTHLQERLKHKLKDSSVFPFCFQLPPGLASSVTLQQPRSKEKSQKRCGVDYVLCVFVGSSETSRVKRRNSVRLNIRKLTYAAVNPDMAHIRPSVEASHKPMLSKRPVLLQATLDKELYHHHEPINITVNVDNQSNKSVKSIQVRVRQFANLRTGHKAHDQLNCKCVIASLDSSTGCPIKPGTKGQYTFTLTPTEEDNRDQVHLALDGQIKDEDTSLASSTQLTHTETDKNIGLVVSYEVKVKLIVFGGDVVCKVPFNLCKPQPVELGLSQLPFAAMPSEMAANSVFGSEADDDLAMVFEDFMRGRAEKYFGGAEESPSDGED